MRIPLKNPSLFKLSILSFVKKPLSLEEDVGYSGPKKKEIFCLDFLLNGERDLELPWEGGLV